MADDYSEYDFEYLPNGGRGETTDILYTTSWESYAGWHDLEPRRRVPARAPDVRQLQPVADRPRRCFVDSAVPAVEVRRGRRSWNGRSSRSP